MKAEDGSRPVVSVLVTVYNREDYIRAALESILASTFTNFEVIVVDDASRDRSAAVATEIGSHDCRVQVHRNKSNLGDYANRMRAAELARGTYIKYLDSDDLMYRHSLAIMIEAMEAHPDAALGLCHSEPELDTPYPFLLAPRDAWREEFLGNGCLSCGPSGAIMHRDAFLEVGGFGAWGVLSDIDLWYRMSARRGVVLLPPGLVWWRRHETQEYAKSGAGVAYLADGYRLGVDALTSPVCPLSADERLAAVRRARQHHARRLLSLAFRSRRPMLAYSLFRSSGLKVATLVGGIRRYR